MDRVRLAAVLALVGVCAPFALTVPLGMTTGIGAAVFLFLLVAWFVQGMVIFSLPLMLLVPLVRGAAAHAAVGVGVSLADGLLLALWNQSQGLAHSWSAGGALLFGVGGAVAGLYLHRRAQAA